uniref:SCAN box domain-containing protein n=1 Tax=Crocodylus porosus TaxID=8502 RepID=A0A7M4FRQ8_CROPO
TASTWPCVLGLGPMLPQPHTPGLGSVLPQPHKHFLWIQKSGSKGLDRHRQAFRGRKPREARAPCILWQSLGDLMNKWLRPEAVSKEDICDQILLEQFLTDLDEDTQKWVRCHCPTSSQEALQVAEQFDMAQGDLCRDKGMKVQDRNAKRDKESKGSRIS